MIIKNHTIELKDTSASEMARFRQIMLGIWRQQIEDDKNSNEWEKLLKDHYATAKELDAKYANNSKKPDEVTLKGDRYILNNEDHYQYTNASALEEVVVTASISPLVSILLWIKKNIGNKTQKLQLDSFPKNAPLNFKGTIKGYSISCNRQLLEAIVDLKNIEFKVSFPVKTFFLLNIFDLKKNLALRFETDSYEGLEYLAQFIGYDIEAFKASITQQYKKAITEAGSDKDKLDIIYEDIPDFILASLKTDQQMYADIWTLLDQNVSDIGGRDEDQGILNILKTLQKKDAKKLFTKLYERPLWVMRLYETFSGEHRKNFVALIMDLCRYNKNRPEAKQQIYLPNGYWPSNVQLTANWSQNKIRFENTTTILNNLGNNLAYPTSGLYPSAVNEHKKIYKGAPLNPMDFITVKSIIEIDNDKKSTTEAASNQVALFIKYKVDELSQEAFWDVINVATTLAGGYGAIEVLTTQATGKLLKTLAVIELTKTIADLVMLTDRAKKALKEAGLGVLVDNWTTISISADLSLLSLSLLITLAKYGRKGAKVFNDINETEHATHLEKQTEKAFTEIEKQTGVDVSKMSEKEIDKFTKQAIIGNRKIITLADKNQLGTANKVELIDQAGEKVAYITRNMQYGAKKGITYQLNALKEAGMIKKGSKTDLHCEMKLLDSQSAKKYDLTVKQNEEILYLDFNIPAKINEQYRGLGQIIFDDAHTFMKNSKKVPEINGMFGMWIKYPAYYAHYGGESINLKKFLKAVDSGMDEKKAAFETITGAWAKDNGYTKVEFQKEWSREEVIVKFLKE